MNNRPLNYVEEDVELPTLTPNSMLFTPRTYLPELKAHYEDLDLRKRTKFMYERPDVAEMDQRIHASSTRTPQAKASGEG